MTEDDEATRDDPPAEEGDRPAPAIPPPTNPFELYRRNRARLDILLIGVVALGGIVCMAIATAVAVWQAAHR